MNDEEYRGSNGLGFSDRELGYLLFMVISVMSTIFSGELLPRPWSTVSVVAIALLTAGVTVWMYPYLKKVYGGGRR